MNRVVLKIVYNTVVIQFYNNLITITSPQKNLHFKNFYYFCALK